MYCYLFECLFACVLVFFGLFCMPYSIVHYTLVSNYVNIDLLTKFSFIYSNVIFIAMYVCRKWSS